MSNKDTSSNMERTKKRVEWSSNLSSVESYAPEDRSPNWDTESGHILSFLFDVQHQDGLTSPPQSNATPPSGTAIQTHHHGGVNHQQPQVMIRHLGGGGSDGQMRQGAGQSGFKGGPSDPIAFDDDPVPPPTPATQYYHHASKPRSLAGVGRPPASAASAPIHPMNTTSNDSIINIKASMASGRPPLSSNASADQSVEPLSPISPAAMIGPAQEPLMLPPSPDSGPNAFSASPSSNFSSKQQHYNWLQQINATIQQQASKILPLPQSVPTQQPQQPHSNMPPPNGAMGYPPMQHGMPTLQSGYIPTPMYYSQAALNQLQQQQQQPTPQESEEKRARRLERNRESARKSRRRKKEKLSHLEAKVEGLHTEIEAARNRRIVDMNQALETLKTEQMVESLEGLMPSDGGNGNSAMLNQLGSILRDCGPNSTVHRAVTDFQYTTLKQTLLPRYQKILLWLTLHEEGWFSAGKEHHARREGEGGKLVSRVTSGKISSKQVGDELTNGRKLEDGTIEPPPQSVDSGGEKGGINAQAYDALRMWPLMCFELSVSVDQEERLVNQIYKSASQMEDLPRHRSQIEAAARMASNLRETVLLQSHNTAVRSERTYLDILTPQQTIVYQKWLANNRNRCRDGAMKYQMAQAFADGASGTPLSIANLRSENSSADADSLMDICRRLEEVLKISKGQTTADEPMT